MGVRTPQRAFKLTHHVRTALPFIIDTVVNPTEQRASCPAPCRAMIDAGISY